MSRWGSADWPVQRMRLGHGARSFRCLVRLFPQGALLRNHQSDPLQSIVFSPGDGATLSCYVRQVGRARQDRWIVRTAAGLEFVGPPAAWGRTTADTRSLIATWWGLRKALGYADVNAAILRARLATNGN